MLGRTKSGTLRLFDEPKGLRFELDLPDSPLGQNVRTAVSRGDLDGASFRFEVGDEAWDGDTRTIKNVKALHDVTLATYPAYPAASVELRTKPATREETAMEDTTPSSPDGVVEAVEDNKEPEQRTTTTTGTLRVTERDQTGSEARTLFDKFKQAGWTGSGRAEISWNDYETASESRSLTWSGSVDGVSQQFGVAAPFGYDVRYAWPAFRRVSVDAGVTSVNILTQSTRSLPAGGTAVRAIDAVTAKPLVGGTVAMVATSMKQIAAVSSGIPNVYLENQGIADIVSSDLRLAYADGLDLQRLRRGQHRRHVAAGSEPVVDGDQAGRHDSVEQRLSAEHAAADPREQ